MFNIQIMNIQLIGTVKCKNTQKAQRFLKERSIKFHFKNLLNDSIKKGEWVKFFQQYSADKLIDEKSKEFKDLALTYKVYDPQEELQEHQGLLITPILRIDNKFYVGFDEGLWKTIIQI
jgi:arsenate reductase